MLEIRPTCENSNIYLPYDSKEALICTFECTYCRVCVELLNHVCPNCGGGFEKRPVKPVHLLKNKYPVSKVVEHKPVEHKPVDINAYLQNLRSK
jgi:hypothetical protein